MTDRNVEQIFDLVNDFTDSILGRVDVARKLDIDGRNYFVVGNMSPRQPNINSRRYYTFEVEPNQLHTISVYGKPEGGSIRVDDVSIRFDKLRDGYQFVSNSDGIVTISFYRDQDLPFIDGTAKIKLEKGDKVTGWTPAPEDEGDL